MNEEALQESQMIPLSWRRSTAARMLKGRCQQEQPSTSATSTVSNADFADFYGDIINYRLCDQIKASSETLLCG